MFDFPNAPVEGQVFSPVGGPSYTYKSGVWRNSDQQVMGDTWWPDRASFVTAVSLGMPIANGKIYTAGGYMYVGKLGQSAIADLPNLLPLGDVFVEHFGAFADMTYEMPPFTQSLTYFQKTGAFIGPWRLTGTDQRAAFEAADNYVVNVRRSGVFYAESNVNNQGRSGYYIDGQFILQGTMVSRKEFRNVLWLNNSNVMHSNIFINSVKGGVKGFNLIAQYSYTGVAKPFGHGCIGCGITVGTMTAPTGGPAIAIDQATWPVTTETEEKGTRVPFITDVEIDVRMCRAGHGVRTGFPGISQISNGSFLFFGVGGIEHCHFKLGIFEQTNRPSNGLGICHWNLIYDASAGGDPLTNYSACIPVETYHACNVKVEFTTDVNMFDTPMGFAGAWESASMGFSEIGELNVWGCMGVSLTPGDLINHYANPAQKEKIMKGMVVGGQNMIDVPVSGDPGPTIYAGANIYLRGFGTSKFDVDIYETTVNRNICRQLEVDVTYKKLNLLRSGKNGFTPRWGARGFYAQGCQGKISAVLTTRGIGRGYEIEYCDGDQQLNYIEGDGCLLYEFSRGGRLLQTDTNREVPGYVENVNDGAYRPGHGSGTKAISIAGGSYSTVVNATGAQVNTTTKTYIVPFGGADDDVYRGTPIQIGDQWVTATEFIQGRSQSSSGLIEATNVSITGISRANPGIITAPLHAYSPGMWVAITGVQGMTQINGLEGRVVPVITGGVIDPDRFSLETPSPTTGLLEPLDTTGFSAYVSGGVASQKLPTVAVANITQANAAVVTCQREHGYYPNQFVGIFNVVGLSLPTPGTPFALSKISKGNPCVVTVTNSSDAKQFFNGQEVTIVGADAEHAAANGRHIVAGFNATAKTFQLVGVDTSAATGDQTTGTMTAAPHKSGINGKQGKVTYIDEFTFSINIDTLVSPALTPYVANTGGVVEAFEGVGYLEHTPLAVPAVNGQKVTVNEFCRVKQGSITSAGGETGVRMLNAGIDNCDMHGLRSAYKYGALMTNGRISMKGPMPLTVGYNATISENFTIKGDGNSLFSAADGSIDDNPHVAYHIKMDKEASTGSTGHADIRACRIANIAKLMEGNASKLRFALTMNGCTDTQINQLLSHPSRQGQDEDQVVGGKGFYNYGDDGKLECWTSGGSLQTDAGGKATWTFPAAFNGGAETIEVSYSVSGSIGAVRTFSTVGRASTAVQIEVYPPMVTRFDARAVGRWFADSPTTPVITDIVPATWVHGDAFKTVTINGTGFDPTSVFVFGNVVQPTTFVSTTQLTAGLDTAPYASAQNVPAFVRTGDVTSNVISYPLT